MDRELLKGHLPVLILGVLREKPLHGYAICREIQSRGASELKLKEGTLYPLLYRLERRGHIKSFWETAPSGKQRKAYKITKSGIKMIESHKTEWKILTSLFSTFLGEGWVKQ
ncbi:helix-turn-helix transcriptional regulator [Candidatus Sumerlaeota bacterium]|nr:helix-turn-helix transcriptional regulator [Candidatus Sumerlaeota bacterium]